MSDDGVTRLIHSRQHDPEVVTELERLRGIVLGAAAALAGPSWSERAAVDEAEMLPSAVRHVEAERDRLRRLLDAREDERGRLLTELHRLRAVVDAGIATVASWRALQAVSERNDDSTGAAYEAWVAASDRLGAAVDRLNASGEGT